MFGMLEKLTKAIKINIEIPVPESDSKEPSKESPCVRKIKLKKKKEKGDTAESKEDSIDGVELGDTLMRHMLPDMNSKREKK